jgi:hypothetical protein
VQTIEIKQTFSLSGAVVDAQTNNPQFATTPVTCYAGGRGIAQSSHVQKFDSSNFKMNVSSFSHHMATFDSKSNWLRN